MIVKEILDHEDGSATIQLEDITEEEYYTLTKLGHKENPTNFNEDECFQLGFISALIESIKKYE